MAPFASATAQGAAQKPIPVHKVVTLASTDSGVIANTFVIRVLSDGRVLHNDAAKHRLLLLDTTLKHYEIIADTAGQARKAFGAGQGGLLPYVGDSTIWIDTPSQALVVVDGIGHMGHIMAPLKSIDMVRFFSGSAYGAPGFDVKGRLYYRAELPSGLPPIDFSVERPDSVAFLPDSAPIIRADFDTRRMDTVAMMRIPARKMILRRSASGPRGFFTVFNPVPTTDEWAYLPDGTVAVVRGQDYHVDWFLPDGTRQSTPKMPFDWRRIADDDKRHLVDSMKTVFDSAYTRMLKQVDSINAERKKQNLPNVGVGGRVLVVEPNEIPDYFPPVRQASQIRVDRDGNLWVIPSTSLAATTGAGNVFDVINRNGEIIERVQLPPGRNLHGFGPNGMIYMSVPPQAGWTRLERGRIIRD